MNRIRSFLNGITGKLSRTSVRTLSLAMFAAAFLIAGTSLAYFTQRDVVTNILSGQSHEIRLYEPDWVEAGEKDGGENEPGDQIKKNPYVSNSSDSEVYVRMKLVIKSGGNKLEGEPEKKVLGTIRLADGTPLFKAPEGFVLGADQRVSAIGDSQTYGGTDFTYKDDGWFYYAKGEELTPLAAGAATPELFKQIDVPILKDEYYGTFDKGLEIYVVAQGIPVTQNSDGTAMIFDQAQAYFNSRYIKYNFE